MMAGRNILLAVGLSLFAAYVALTASLFEQGRAAAANGGQPNLTDFTSLYGASRLLQTGEAGAIYSVAPMYRAQLDAAHAAYPGQLSEVQVRSQPYAAWRYPPVFMLLVMPLGLLGYWAAYGVWLAVTALPYVTAIGRISGVRAGLPLALAAPPLFFNLYQGQTGLLTAGLVGLGLALLRTRPSVAGLLIGLACFKPQFGVLLPLALLLGGHGRAFASAAVTVLLLILASLWAFGVTPWVHFFDALGMATRSFDAGLYRLDWMSSVLGSVVQFGGGVTLGWVLQLVVSLGVTVLVAVAWRDREAGTFAPRAALLCSASLLVVPMVFLYDLLLLVPAAAWLLADMRDRPAAGWEEAAVVVLLALPLFQLSLGGALTAPLGWLATVGMLSLAYRRCRR